MNRINNIVELFLKDRDSRVDYQKMLVNKYKKPIICIRINYPGINKINDVTKKINKIIYKALVDVISDKILFENSYTSLEGPMSILVVDADSFELKKLCVSIEENHGLGRLVDIDVYDENYCVLSRADFNMKRRKCYICEDLAIICSRVKKHSEDEIISFVESCVNNFCLNNIYEVKILL